MLLTKIVIVKWHPITKNYYIKKGYIFTKFKDEFEVAVEDLSDGSNVLVDIECDGCEKKLNIWWVGYKRTVKENGKIYCHKCAHNKHTKWISFYEWCYVHLSKELADYILSRWDYELNIDKNGNKLSPKDISFSSVGINKIGYWFKCLDHSEHKSEQKRITSFTSGRKGSIECIQCNVLAITHPHLMKYLVNKEDGYKYSYGSNIKVPMRCPDCGHEKEIRIGDLKAYGFGCPRCSDGVPYPEKFMFNIFEQLQVDFKPQLSKTTLKWCGKYRYDNYIHNINAIVETHGIQHYEERISREILLEEIQENDKQKEQLAKNNGIKNYIIIDCRKSDMKWIKDSIMQSKLPNLLNFKESDIDWLKCHSAGCSSLVKTACNLWNEMKNTQYIADKLQRIKQTIIKYLKQGAEIGWCNYDSEKEKKNNLYLIQQKGCKQVICLTTGEIFDSQKDAANKYNIGVGKISECCRENRKSTGKHPETGERLVWNFYKNNN